MSASKSSIPDSDLPQPSSAAPALIDQERGMPPISDPIHVSDHVSTSDLDTGTQPSLTASSSPVTSCVPSADATIPCTATNIHPMQTRSKRGIYKPKAPYVRLTLADSDHTPTTAKEALSSPLWTQAMIEEFTALQRNRTWTLVPRPSSETIVDNKWIFKSKLHPDGTLAKRKARLVQRGSNKPKVLIFMKPSVL